jgi:hypothetical protein
MTLELDELSTALTNLGKNWNFDMFFVKSCAEFPVEFCGAYIVNKYNFHNIFDMPSEMPRAFFGEVEKLYYDNPYHNATHAADVLNSTLFFLSSSKLMSSMSGLELLGAVISSLCHDVGHIGQTNRFLCANKHPIALKYNDASVLESMHCALTFKLL